MEPVDVKQIIKRLNIEFLSVAKVTAANGERGYVKVRLGLDDPTIKEILSLNKEETEEMADVGAAIFKLKHIDIQNFKKLKSKGNSDRAASLLRAGLLSDCGKEDEA